MTTRSEQLRDDFELVTDVPASYLPLGEGRYAPTIHVQGAWRDDEQHMAPVGGLIAHAIERHEPRHGMQLARVSYDILGVMPARPSTIEVRTLRPGRTIELVEATMSVEDRPVVRARAWRLATGDTSSVADLELKPMPGPDEFPAWTGMKVWPGGYIRSLDLRSDPARRPGRSRVWLRSPNTLVAGEQVAPTAAFLAYADTANGVAVRVSPGQWAFPNVDLTIHLLREPVPGWVGLDTRVSFGDNGIGLTSSVLHDVQGPVGTVEQILTIRPLPGA
ncbi:MAG: thioesterase family protein [Intrasporangium sp.]|uniref:thioesterase family protein n=1 Tax=Intrasporangium sp. TaxID=1925024 RepID=UPI0026487906|nr:thioesterase family protein [Intrasporangium sp.]MDN5795148.1 thioesterase family protein [Intrasporangium sp.]